MIKKIGSLKAGLSVKSVCKHQNIGSHNDCECGMFLQSSLTESVFYL